MSKTPYEHMEERFKLYASERTALSIEYDPEEDGERYKVLTDNIDCLLSQVVKLGFVKSEPLEGKVYHVTFGGRVSGELREAA